MAQGTNDIVAISITDKREVVLKSPNMEKLGLIRQLSDFEVTVSEVATDAHPQITVHLLGRFCISH
jgi:hypothetical protein